MQNYFLIASIVLNFISVPMANAKVDPSLEHAAQTINAEAKRNNQPFEVTFIENNSAKVDAPDFKVKSNKDTVVLEVHYNPILNTETRRALELHDYFIASIQEKLGSPLQLIEIISNSNQGDLFARHDLLALRIYAKESLLTSLNNNSFDTYSRITRDAHEKLLSTKSQEIQSLKQEIDILKKELNLLLKEAENNEREGTKQREIRTSRVLDNYERQAEQLNDLILKNDRNAVRKMLETYLPVELMNQGEKSFWKQWLDAIDKPNWENSVVVFRGLGRGKDRLESAEINGKVNIGFLSPLLSRSQEPFTKRLRSLVSARKRIGSQEEPNKEQILRSSGIVAAARNHTENPGESPFISTTPNFSIARGFATNGIVAFRFDPRRLFVNVGSDYPNEQEILVPVIIFPDEVLAIKTWDYGDSKGRLNPFAKKIQSFLTEADRIRVPDVFRQLGLQSFKPVFGNVSGGLCKGLFE
ncbi:MAG: hypothetical protein IPM97_05040 [Bdellovibrionaceae bacterium]|nr:hypothetical protein [Pseudobdellovibrionaceae bacterium]